MSSRSNDDVLSCARLQHMNGDNDDNDDNDDEEDDDDINGTSRRSHTHTHSSSSSSSHVKHFTTKSLNTLKSASSSVDNISSLPRTSYNEAAFMVASAPKWVRRMMKTCDFVDEDYWTHAVAHVNGCWQHLPIVCVCVRLARQLRWTSADVFAGIVQRIAIHSHAIDVVASEIEDSLPLQSMERFICTQVLLALRSRNANTYLSRHEAVLVTQHMATHLKSQAFQRAALEYTWDRVVFDTIPFLIGVAVKLLNDVEVSQREASTGLGHSETEAEDVSEASKTYVETMSQMALDRTNTDASLMSTMNTRSAAMSLSRSIVGTTMIKVYAWHLITAMEQSGRLEAVRAVATDLLLRSSPSMPPLIACCRSEFRANIAIADVAAVLVVEHHQGGAAARRTDEIGNNALHYAADAVGDDRGRLVRVLVSAGLSLNATNNAGGFTPLAIACGAGVSGRRAPVRIVDELLDHGADYRIDDVRGMVPLHYAVLNGHCDIVTLLQQRGADMNVSDHDGLSLVHLAAGIGSLPMISLLASLGAELGVCDNAGDTPLRVAIERKHYDAANFIFETRNWLAAREDVLRREARQHTHVDAADDDEDDDDGAVDSTDNLSTIDDADESIADVNDADIEAAMRSVESNASLLFKSFSSPLLKSEAFNVAEAGACVDTSLRLSRSIASPMMNTVLSSVADAPSSVFSIASASTHPSVELSSYNHASRSCSISHTSHTSPHIPIIIINNNDDDDEYTPSSSSSSSSSLRVLRSQLPDMHSARSINLCGLGLDHLVPEMCALTSAQRIDLRSNTLHTMWWLPWWYCVSENPICSRTTGYMLSSCFAVVWTCIIVCGCYTSTHTWLFYFSWHTLKLTLGVAHIVMLAITMSFVSLLVVAVFYNDFWAPYERLERQRASLLDDVFRVTRFSNVLALFSLLMVVCQLIALTVPSDFSSELLWLNTFITPLHIVVLDFGFTHTRFLLTLVVSFVCVLRVWFELRAHWPWLWSGDVLLLCALSISFIPCTRTLLRILLCSTHTPSSSSSTSSSLTSSCFDSAVDISMLSAALGALPMIVGLTALCEPILQARNTSCQLRLTPFAMTHFRIFIFILVALDALLAKSSFVHALVFAIAFLCFTIITHIYFWSTLAHSDTVWMFTAASIIVTTPAIAVLVSICIADQGLGPLITQTRILVFIVAVVWALVLVTGVTWMYGFARRTLRAKLAQQQTMAAAKRRWQAVRRLVRMHPLCDHLLGELQRGVPFAGLAKRFSLRTWLLRTFGENHVQALESLFVVPQELIEMEDDDDGNDDDGGDDDGNDDDGGDDDEHVNGEDNEDVSFHSTLIVKDSVIDVASSQ